MPHSRIRGEEFEFGGVLRSSSASSLTPKFEFGGVLPSSSSTSSTTPNVSEYGGELSTSNSGGVLPSSSMSSIATPNVASGDLLRQLVLDRPKLPLSRLMQVSSKFKGNLTNFSAKEIPPNVVISAEHALVATVPASSTKPNSPPTSGRAGSSSPEPETVPVEPQKSEPTSPMEWNPDTLLASSSTATDETKQKPIVTITQSSSEEIRMLAPNITIEYRGPVPTFSTPLQPPVRKFAKTASPSVLPNPMILLLDVQPMSHSKVNQQTPQFSLRILPTHPLSQDFDWLEMTDTVSDTIRNTPLGALLKVRLKLL